MTEDRKQIALDRGAWEILTQKGKVLAKKDGITFPSLSDAVRAMDKRIKKV